MNIELTEEQKVKIYSDRELYPVMRQILLRDNEIDKLKEHFWTVGLATNNILLYIELVTLGSLRQTIVEPMDVFSWALQKRVDKIILVHNHPSGVRQQGVIKTLTYGENISYEIYANFISQHLT